MYSQVSPGDPHAAPMVGAVSRHPGVAPAVTHFNTEPSGAHSACPSGYVQMSPLLLQVAGSPPGLTSDQVAGQPGSFDATPADESETSVSPPASELPHFPPDLSVFWWHPKLPASAHSATRPPERRALPKPVTALAEQIGLVTPREAPPRIRRIFIHQNISN
jgi:hypothetical protein